MTLHMLISLCNVYISHTLFILVNKPRQNVEGDCFLGLGWLCGYASECIIVIVNDLQIMICLLLRSYLVSFYSTGAFYYYYLLFCEKFAPKKSEPRKQTLLRVRRYLLFVISHMNQSLCSYLYVSTN